MIIPGVVASGQGSGYVGPLDLVPGAVVAYSASRALSAARIGQNVVKLRRNSDDATLNFVAGANGSVDAAAITTWLAGANGFIDTLYDQSGNGSNLTQATKALQPGWLANQANGHPGLTWPTQTELMTTAGSITLPGTGISILEVAKSTSVDASTGQLLGINFQNSGTGDPNMLFGFSGGAAPDTSLRFYGGTYHTNDVEWTSNLGTAQTGAMRLYTVQATFAAARFTVDGASAGATKTGFNGAALGAMTGVLAYGADDAAFPAGIFKGVKEETFIYASSISDANCLLLSQNMATYYGITLN